MRWRNPKEAMSMTGKIVLALVGAMAVTGLMTVTLPFGDLSPATPERAIAVGVFYTVWMFLIFKFVFGEFVPRKAFKSDGA